MLASNHLCFDYAERPLLKNLSFKIESGELLHLKGVNGIGKSTLLKILATLYQPTCGELLFHHQPIEQCLMEYRAAIRYLGHQEGIHPLLTPSEYFTYELGLCWNKKVIDSLLLEEIWNKPFALLSAGQKKRVSFLRLLSTTAQLWLLDETWVSLDQSSTEILKELIESHLIKGGAVITTSHQALPFEKKLIRELVLC